MNVTEIEALGAEFDPNFHNAIQQQSDTDYADNHVCAVFQKGYMMGDKLIRPAMVAVAKD
jgi:molecular chaperone GrpE